MPAGVVTTASSVKQPVARDGWYRMHFAGTTYSSAAASTPDYVDVR